MFKKLLLPLDLTDRHEHALQIAADLARASGGEVTLLHAIELIQGLSRDEEPTFYDRLERVATAHLQRWGTRLAENEVPVRGEVIFGDRLREVVQYASHTGTDLIILTSERLDPENPASGLGSLSYRIGLFCNCPVLLVK
jgi:nucleotide-binding universal stress UspA family protein